MSILDEFSRTASSVLHTVAGSVVSVGRDGRGTGLIVGDGKVLTNAHNLRDRTTTVTFADGRVADASVAGADEDGDLVVLDVDTGGAQAVSWAEQAPQAGDLVFAASRGGHRLRVSFGMISAIDLAFTGPRGRQVRGGVEHTAALPHGSSGGPLLDRHARVLGVNTHRVGRGFYVARPVDQALRATIGDLTAGRSVERPQLGVALAPTGVAAKLRASVGLPAREGLLVRGVSPEGPAARAGIEVGDLLVEINGTPLDTIDALQDALGSDPTATLHLSVVRGTDERIVDVQLRCDDGPS